QAASADAQAPPAPVADGHRILQHEVGAWDAVVRTWATPDAQPAVSRGTETNRMLGQMWVVGVFESGSDGTSYRGQSQVGYDPVAKKYMGTWIDTMSPHLNTFEGTMQGNQLTMKTKGLDPKTGQQKLTKMVTTYVDDDHKTYESFEPVPGKEGQLWKTMEVSYTRRK
ncbi:MAG: DUF1579 domain-containing protein, partial [Bythopirellula sp.]